MIRKLRRTAQRYLDKTRAVDFVGLLCLRLYLVPIFWMAGTQKLSHMDSTIAWFGNAEWGLGLPFPTLFAYLASGTEVIGAVLLLLGFGVRWISIPLMATMAVAAVTVHFENGWLAIASQSSEATQRLQAFLGWLQEAHPGRWEHITGLGDPVMLNNGVEFAITYFIMLLVLFFFGAGRYSSVDYWIARRFC